MGDCPIGLKECTIKCLSPCAEMFLALPYDTKLLDDWVGVEADDDTD